MKYLYWVEFFGPSKHVYLILRSFDMSLTSGRPLYSVSFSSVYHNTDDWLQLVRKKLPVTHWSSLATHVNWTERRASQGQAEPIAHYCFKKPTTVYSMRRNCKNWYAVPKLHMRGNCANTFLRLNNFVAMYCI